MFLIGLVVKLYLIISCVYCHGDDVVKPNFLLVYVEELTTEMRTLMKDKIIFTVNTSVKDDRDSILQSIITGCMSYISGKNCSSSCSPIWSSMKKKNLQSVVIGVPYKLVFNNEWPSFYFGHDVLQLPLVEFANRIFEMVEIYKISLIMICLDGSSQQLPFIKLMFGGTKLNIVLWTGSSKTANRSSQVFMAGPSFKNSKSLQGSINPVDIYSLINAVLEIDANLYCPEGNNSIFSGILRRHHKDTPWSTFVIIVAIITTSLVLSLVMIIMSIKGVFVRKQKFNRFNLGARVDSITNRKQPERNYLLDSSDDEELFSGSSRSPNIPTILKIDGNLSEITLH